MVMRNRMAFWCGVAVGFVASMAPVARGQEVPVAAPIAFPSCDELVTTCVFAATERYKQHGDAERWRDEQLVCLIAFEACVKIRDWFAPFIGVLEDEVAADWEAWEPQEPLSPGPGNFGGGVGGGPLDGITPKDETVTGGGFTGDSRNDDGFVQPAVHPRKARPR